MDGLSILVAGEDQNVRDLTEMYFRREGAQVVTVADGEQALALANSPNIDLVILDVMMPALDGFAVCRELRKNSDVPVVMLTARGEEADRVLGLELGADDYVVKPFSPRELVARVKAILRRGRLRRSSGAANAAALTFAPLSVNPQAREVLVEGNRVRLAPKEFDLLLYLVQNPRLVLDRDQILTRVWGYDFPGETRTVDVHVKKLRLKLGAPVRNFIQTVWGIGYKFEAAHYVGH